MTSTKGIVKLGNNLYEIRVQAVDPRTGKRKAVERVRECTQTEAEALQAVWREELVASFKTVKVKRVRLRDFVPSWLSGRLEEGELKPSSADKIAVVWDLHIAPSKIADLFTDDIGTDDVTAWVDELRAKRYAPGRGKATTRKAARTTAYSKGTIRGYFRVLRTILNAAGAEGACKIKLKTSPLGVVKHRMPRKEKNHLKADELDAILSEVEKGSPEWYPAVLLDVFVGLRWGELSALRWSDIDEAKAVIQVERGNSKGRLVNSTKTGDDEDPHAKVVPLLPEVAEVLRARRQQMIADQHPGLCEGWIFPTEKGGLHKGSPLRKVIGAALVACEIDRRVTPHGLRHTANDLLRRVAKGEVVRAIIGHKTEAMTHHYSHVDEDEKATAVRTVFAIVRGGNGVVAGVSDSGSMATTGEPKIENPAIAGLSVGGATQI